MFSTQGDAEFRTTVCDRCGKSADLIDPLSVSVTAERLLYRSKAELDGGDYSLAIVIAVMAVESFLTRLYFKIRGMEAYMSTFTLPTPAQEAEWEGEYPRTGASQDLLISSRNSCWVRLSTSSLRGTLPRLRFSQV